MADFGPNRDAVESFLERIRFLEEGDALALTAAWQEEDEQRRRHAWRALRRAARRSGRDAALGNAQSALMDWLNSWSPLLAPGPVIGGAQVRADVTKTALPALVDAVSALVVGGQIDGDDFETLYGPWRSVDSGASPA